MIERASPSDRAFLAVDAGEVPEQFGAILMLAMVGGLDLDCVPNGSHPQRLSAFTSYRDTVTVT